MFTNTRLEDELSEVLWAVANVFHRRLTRAQKTITGTSRDASVSDTSVWQLAFLPSAEANCDAPPTECVPFFGKNVSSIINQACGSPTCRSASASSDASKGQRPRCRWR